MPERSLEAMLIHPKMLIFLCEQQAASRRLWDPCLPVILRLIFQLISSTSQLTVFLSQSGFHYDRAYARIPHR